MNEFGEEVYQPPEDPTVDEALAKIFDSRASDVSFDDLALFGAYYEWVQARTANGEDCSFKRFAYDYGKRPDVSKQVPTSDAMSDLFTRLEKRVRQLLVPRTYGASNQNLGDVDMTPGLITGDRFNRDPSRFTVFGHMVGRWVRILHLVMDFPRDPDAADAYVRFLDGVETGLKAQHAVHSEIVAEYARHKSELAGDLANARARSTLARLGRKGARAAE